jgi:hypothetical protein
MTRSVADVAPEPNAPGVDVHLINPSYTWVPWWQSAYYPVDRHIEWFHERYASENLPPERITQYVQSGGDLVSEFIQAAREHNQVPFLSFRLNDHHYLDRTGPDDRDLDDEVLEALGSRQGGTARARIGTPDGR